MINTIIFDFGDVFINLDKAVVARELAYLENPGKISELKNLNDAYEVGNLATEDFLRGLQGAIPGRSREELKNLWNAMLLDFPLPRLNFLENLAASKQFRLFLLSNTNELHISSVQMIMGTPDYNRFLSCFDRYYFSHELHLRKPEPEIFQYVLEQNKLEPGDTLFVDDTLENIEAAARLGISTWHLQVGKEDITELKTKF